MLSKFLVTNFIKDYNNISDEKVRNSYGYLGGIVGIIANILLFIVKIFVGFITNSIAVIADAVNNLSDAASSIITIIGFKLASKPADAEHPFGHGRIEYISGLIVSFMVMLVGFEFIKTSFKRIINPTNINFQLMPFLLLLVSILTKIWLSYFNKYIGKTIDSSALQASSLDALGDVFTSSCVALSLLASKWTSTPIDGYVGVLVSIFILYSGFSLTKETLDPILGEAPDPELVKKLIDGVCSYDYISGVHDIIIHNYGPGKAMASVHAEVPCDISVMKIHEIIDTAEKELSEKLNIFLVIHMDPINTNDEKVNSTKNELLKIIHNDFPIIKSIHDFRIVGDNDFKNLIFDIVIDYEHVLTPEIEEKLKKDLDNAIKTIHPHYNAIITIDRDFTSLK
ncbi:ferrous-iron efflux pump FieF [Clostridium acetireducens DSM 10703]|jgi:cation diffusion facilitator family transporter|uniref:Ferrous-iron efflux pump FieF n=1 Tax=Clostridium acetireducens DSM 10703 TaxID=1121290 RepID=A0A1E8F261_9CLOT|nr:cation diffusion facilitator family transporter [Clostridium acetireducens]OFI07446.1 ferrous-iron efflux pump FieF [Clostridium acetireducens DSM 10703]